MFFMNTYTKYCKFLQNSINKQKKGKKSFFCSVEKLRK